MIGFKPLKCIVAATCGLVLVRAAAAGTPEGLESQKSITPIKGSLVIVGGGFLPDAVRDRFLELAGGKKARLVVIPTANSKADQPDLLRSLHFWKQQEVESVELLHTRDPEQANDPAFIQPLLRATGVWLVGGDQSRLVEAYRGTAVEKELQKLLARGGVIGGTSAGAAVMSPLMILGGNPLARVGPGFGFLPGVVIDQHFQNRNRLNRLLGVLAQNPEFCGLGIDEETALVVTGRVCTVVGNANVRVCLCTAPGTSPTVKVLKNGDQLDLIELIQGAIARGTQEAAGN